MLRNRLPDEIAMYPDPVHGIDLRSGLGAVRPGFAVQMQNCFLDFGLGKRLGSATAHATSKGVYGGRGLAKIYPNTATRFRVAYYNNLLATISDAGAIGTVTTSLTADTNTHFTQWTISDRTYVCNGTDNMGYINHTTQTFVASVTGVATANAPPAAVMAKPYLDRLFVITGTGVTSSNARVDNVFASTGSSWAFYRPSAGTGNPTALALHSDSGVQTGVEAQLLIFQRNAVTRLTGTDFGSDVTAASPPTTWDAAMNTVDSSIGTESPYSIVSIPGIGTFWFTQTRNVAWLPFGKQTAYLIGDKLFSNRADLTGINNTNLNSMANVEMVYHDRKLKLMIPVSANTYSTIQFWLDIRPLQQQMAQILAGEPFEGVGWSGPHTGQSLRRWYAENQGGDADVLYALEGNSANGLFLYRLNESGTYTDAVGTANNNVIYSYRTFYHPFKFPSMQKYIPLVRVDAAGRIENAGMTISDLHSASLSGLRITNDDGTVFSFMDYSGTYLYDGTNKYAGGSNNIGVVDIPAQTGNVILGDALSIEVTHTTGNFVLNSLLPQVQVRRTQQVG